MPSGAKKRKAARKKMERQSVTNHSNGDDEVEHQDDRDSDVSSRTSQDYNSHQNHLSEGDEEENEKGENNSHNPAKEALKTKDSEEPSNVLEDDVPVDREFEIEDKSSKKVCGSSSGSSSHSHSNNSSRSGSDDESHGIKKGEAAGDISPVVDLGNGKESLSGVPVENIVSADDGVDSVVGNFPAEKLKNTSTLGDVVETDISIAPSIIPMESKEERLSFVDDNGVTTVFMDVPSKRKDESIENVVNPDPKERVTQEIHDGVATDIGVEVGKDSGVTEVLLVHAPRPVQATTWKSCCGLFELFAGSGR